LNLFIAKKPVQLGIDVEGKPGLGCGAFVGRLRKLQALAIQGPGMIASVWPDRVILLYISGLEFTIE
jgi:hypothetical protein